MSGLLVLALHPGDAHAEAARVVERFDPGRDLLPALLLAATLALYLAGLARLRRAAPRGTGVRWPHAASFVVGWLAMALALVSPIATISEALFSVHMVQHELLMVVAPPLMVFARPWPVFLMALAPRGRHAVTAWVRRPGPSRFVSLLSSGLAAFVLHGLALWIWHVPRLFEAALANPWIHDLEHLSFFLTALMFWGALVHGRYGRLGWGMSVLFVFLTALHSGVLGAVLTVAPRVWYEAYAARTGAWGLTPLEDQQLAGLFMWIPAGLLLTLFALGMLGAALGDAARRTRGVRDAS